jgi:Flp pilus assembly pilin Flp
MFSTLRSALGWRTATKLAPDCDCSIGKRTMAILRILFKRDEGRVSIEYALLVAFVALASAELCLSLGHNVFSIWSLAGSRLEVANTSVRRQRANRLNATKMEMGESESKSAKSHASSGDAAPHE